MLPNENVGLAALKLNPELDPGVVDAAVVVGAVADGLEVLVLTVGVKENNEAEVVFTGDLALKAGL